MIAMAGKKRTESVTVDGGAAVAIREGGLFGFETGGHAYEVKREGTLRHSFELRCGDAPVARADAEMLRNRFAVSADGRVWSLRATALTGKRFGLFDGDARVGEIRWAGKWFRADVIADLPADMPLAVQVFLSWIVQRHIADAE